MHPVTDDSVEKFIADLRGLREGLADVPTWDAMANRAKRRGVKVGRSTLHNIVSTGKLPSELAVRGYVLALSDDTDLLGRWLARRSALAPPPDDQADVVQTERTPGRRWWRAAVSVAILLVTNTATGLVVYNISKPDVPQNTAQAATSDDPLRTPCIKDVKVATAYTKNSEFLLEILFSETCDAGWARITRYDSKGTGNRVQLAIYRRSDPTGNSRQEATEPDVQSAYTTLIVRADPTDRLCATGAIFTEEKPLSVETPICT